MNPFDKLRVHRERTKVSRTMKKGSALMEYAIILGVVGLALLTMNIYIKRGLQGRVKDMADGFINNGEHAQVVEVDPEVEMTSNTQIVSDSYLSDKVAVGGSKSATFLETTSVATTSLTKDRGRVPTKPDAGDFTPAEEGGITPPIPQQPKK